MKPGKLPAFASYEPQGVKNFNTEDSENMEITEMIVGHYASKNSRMT